PLEPAIAGVNLASGMYTFTYQFPASGSCQEVSTDVVINVVPAPQFEVTPAGPSCAENSDGTISISILEQSDGPYAYLIDEVVQTGPDISGLAAGTYEVSVENVYGCRSVIPEVVLDTPSILTVDIGPDRTVERGTSVVIQAMPGGDPGVIVTWQWATLSGSQLGTDPILNLTMDSDTTVRLTITDINGCTASDTVTIRVTSSADFYFPNVFSPVSPDPANRRFGVIAGPGIGQIISFAVFSRWGETLFTVSNRAPDDPGAAWDGTFNGEAVLPGVYIYRIRLLIDGKEFTKAGDVTLIR
ncbi:MAG: gliding motility-associated C-terminal domain-containing protein, partial [Saprospiraceae bacterium]|nr:gliding motility-associated C-terminal domain-containing protein [Saprospiraceae bacterium]